MILPVSRQIGDVFEGVYAGSSEEIASREEGGVSTITRNDLVKEVRRRTGCTKTLAKQVVDSTFDAMRENLVAGDRIEIRGFGVCTVRWKKPNPNAWNARTRERISVPARRKVHFKPGKVLKKGLSEPAGE